MYRLVCLLTCLLLLAACAGNIAGKRQRPRTAFVPVATPGQEGAKPASAIQHPDELTPLELQVAVMSFADTANSRIAEAAAVIELIGTPQARLTAARMMVFDVSSNIEIAAGPYPGVALLDMIVVTSLRRMVWEDYWIPRFGYGAESAMEFFRDMEQDIWEIAAKVLTPDQMDELATIILQWRKRNPRQVAVNYIRFSDFGELGLKPSMRQIAEPGGIFDSVKAAAMVAQDMKVAIDRAFFLMSRMQLVMSFQIELAYLEMMFQPEADGLINQTERIAGITERYAEIAEKLPEKLSGETSKVITQLFTNLDKNRDELLKGTFAGLTQWQDTTIKAVMESISAEREAALNQAIEGLMLQQQELYQRVDKLVDASGDEIEETMDRAFILAALLMVLFFVLLTLYRVFVVRSRRSE